MNKKPVTQPCFMPRFKQLFIGLMLLAIGKAMASTSHAADLAITNVTVVSPERAAQLTNATVLIKDGRITDVLQSNTTISADRVISGEGKFLIPGLIDSHVHLYHAPGLKPRYSNSYQELYRDYMTRLPKNYLYYGYTTLIETNADSETNIRYKSADVRPNLSHCGKGIILSDGYMAAEIPQGRLADAAPNFLHDAYNNGYLPQSALASEHTPQAVIARHAKTDAVCVKIYYEEALWMPKEARTFKLPSVKIMRELVAAAHDEGLPVIIHATSPAGYHFATQIGVDIISHGPWDWEDNDYTSEEIPSAVYSALNAAAAKGTKVQPTFSALRHTISMFDDTFLQNPQLQSVLSKDYIHYLETGAQKQKAIFKMIFGPRIVDNPNDSKIQKALFQMYARYGRIVQSMHANGVNLIFGTDTSSGGFGWGTPAGLSGYMEMQNWYNNGVSLKQILAAATLENAKAFAMDHDRGTVEVGKIADLVLLTKNPLETITAYDNIDGIVLGGTWHTRQSLQISQNNL